MASYTRAQLLALTPDRYLADGYIGPDGTMRREFISDYATAASTQFIDAELSPQELALTAEAVRQILPLQHGSPGERARATVEEALALISNSIKQHSNERLARWLRDCAAAVGTEADLQAFLAHVQATERQYAVIAAFTPEPSSSPPPSPPEPSPPLAA